MIRKRIIKNIVHTLYHPSQLFHMTITFPIVLHGIHRKQQLGLDLGKPLQYTLELIDCFNYSFIHLFIHSFSYSFICLLYICVFIQTLNSVTFERQCGVRSLLRTCTNGHCWELNPTPFIITLTGSDAFTN